MPHQELIPSLRRAMTEPLSKPLPIAYELWEGSAEVAVISAATLDLLPFFSSSGPVSDGECQAILHVDPAGLSSRLDVLCPGYPGAHVCFLRLPPSWVKLALNEGVLLVAFDARGPSAEWSLKPHEKTLNLHD